MPPKPGASTNALVRSKAGHVSLQLAAYGSRPVIKPESTGFNLLAADRETLAAFRAAPFEHEPAVFRAHSHQKSMRALAMPGVRLERTLSLHAIPSSPN